MLTQGDMTGSNVLWLEGSAIQGFPGTDGATKRSKEYFTDNTIPGNAFVIMEKATGVHWGSDVNNNGYPVPDFLGGVNTYFYMQGEHGTEQNPYIVENIDDLNEIRRRLESGYPFEGEYISQIADFDFSADNNVMQMIADHRFDLIINIPKNHTKRELTNGYRIRRAAIDHNTPLITNARLASAFINAFCNIDVNELPVKSWDEFK